MAKISLINPPMLPSNKMLCILALLPLTESSAPPPPPLVDALADARILEPVAVARALTEVVRINPILAEGGWLADLRGFDGPERQELSDLLRKEGVGLADRSKLRRLATTAAQSTFAEDDVFGIPRRAQQAVDEGALYPDSARIIPRKNAYFILNLYGRC